MDPMLLLLFEIFFDKSVVEISCQRCSHVDMVRRIACLGLELRSFSGWRILTFVETSVGIATHWI